MNPNNIPENNSTTENIDNEKINIESINNYLNSLENKSKDFIKEREDVIKTLNYAEENNKFNLPAEDIDLLFDKWTKKYYLVLDNWPVSTEWFTGKEFIDKYSQTTFEKWEEIYDKTIWKIFW